MSNGLYFFPPIFYEKALTLPDERDVFLMDDLIDQLPFNGDTLFIHNEGYLATNTDDKDVSERILNSIFLSASLLKYQFHRANKEELDTLKIDLISNEIKILGGTLISIRGCLHIFPRIRKEYPEVIIKKDQFEIILELAEKILNSKFKTAILTFYDSYTLYQLGDYTGCFLFGWITVENYFSKKIEEYFHKMGMSQSSIDKKNRDLTVFKKMNLLKDNKMISISEYRDYDSLRIIRNNIIHSEYKPTQTESQKCKLVANSIMWKLFTMEGINYNYYYDRIQKLSP